LNADRAPQLKASVMSLICYMKPFFNLNAILLDGHSFQCDMPENGNQTVTISTRQIGDLVLASGKLLAWDLFMIPDERYAFKKSLNPGKYPVDISVADFYPAGDSRIACARLYLSEGPTVRWEVAAISNPDHESNENIDKYGVDSGTGSFMDVDAAQVLAPSNRRDEFEGFCDKVIAEMEKHSLGQHTSAGWANMRISESSEANVVTFSSGWGDGGYASFWGYDAGGKLTSLVTDFALFPSNDAT
jgi:hypothetical protein